jgi:hypothetical protein
MMLSFRSLTGVQRALPLASAAEGRSACAGANQRRRL